MVLVSIDDHDMSNVTHAEAVEVVRNSYLDKERRFMAIEVATC